MSQSEKAEFYRLLKDAGVQFSKHYREYSTDELKAAVDKLRAEGGLPEPQAEEELTQEELAEFGLAPAQPQPTKPPPPAKAVVAPRTPKNPDEMPGERLNTSPELEPIRTDDEGKVWYQEEVGKPAFAKPRGRRVLQYMEGGIETQTVQNGEYAETFEVAGTTNRRPAEIKITLPSYQVGIYKDPRFPFKVHTYQGRIGFDLFEVQDYYGGAELVPTELKRVYVENVLCYDVRTTVRAIQTEFRQLQLSGKVR